MTPTPETIRARAATLRTSDERRAAREAETEAVAGELRAAQERVERAQVELAEAKRARAALFADVIAGDGWSQARVGRVVGRSHQRVGQIVRELRTRENGR